MTKGKELYIGLIGVVPLPGNKEFAEETDGAKGAYVNALALAWDPEDFGRQVIEALYDLGFDVTQIDDVELFSDRKANYEIDPNLKELAEKVLATSLPEFDGFYPYLDDDA